MPYLASLISLVILLTTGLARADVGPGLYVSDLGRDNGDCTDYAEPCRTITYALDIAPKNTRIHVAAGRYEFGSVETILYAMSGAVHVHGGYVKDDQGQWIKGGVAYLTGVPPGYRSFFAPHGFVVIADAKGDGDYPERANVMLDQFQRAQQSAASAECVTGMAAGFSCSNIDLLSQTARQDFSSAPMSVADIWGFVDLNTRREYVIVGVRNGAAVFDVTDRQAPREIGFVGGQAATWRDIKIYQFYDDAEQRFRAYAYVTTDGAADGLMVIDLGDLPHAISRIGYASDFSNAHNVYLTNTDYATGLALDDEPPQLIVAGSGLNNGQFRSYSLADPEDPAFTQGGGNAGYMHDASSFRVNDSRAAECGGTGSCTVLLDFNEENILLWDVTNAASPGLLATVPEYPNRGYVHSGWWSEDRRHLFVHDELDERSFGLPTTLRVLNLDDLGSPQLAGQWVGDAPSVDHNGFVRGNRYYMSTYTSGLKVLDISDPTNPVEVGDFDTYPVGQSDIFAGAWGAYPYLSGGTIAVSDINSGLYLLRDQTRAVAAGQIGFSLESYTGSEDNQAVLEVERVSGSTGPVSVGIELVGSTADDSDFSYGGGRLTWPDGDASTRMLPVDIMSDANSEGLEEFIVRLVDPQGGATLGIIDSSSVFISEPAASAVISLRTDAIEVSESGAGLAIVTIRREGSAAGAVSVGYSVAAGSAAAGIDFAGPTSGTLTWQDGDARPQSIEFQVLQNIDIEPTEEFSVTLDSPQGATLSGPAQAVISIIDGSAANTAPVVSAGADQIRTSNTNVMLNGSATFDPDGDALTYTWTQEAGPTVSLNGAATDSATFVAPTVSSGTDLDFRLTVTDDQGLSASQSTTVSVTPPGPGNDDRGGGSGSPGPWLLIALLMALTVQRRQRPN